MGFSSCKPLLKCDDYTKKEDELINLPNDNTKENQNQNNNSPIEHNNNKNKKNSTDLSDNPYLDRINLSPIRETNKENYYDNVGKDDNVFNSIDTKDVLSNKLKGKKNQFTNNNESEKIYNKETSNKFQNENIESYENINKLNNNNNNNNNYNNENFIENNNEKNKENLIENNNGNNNDNFNENNNGNNNENSNENSNEDYMENYNKNFINNDIVYKFSWKNIDILSIIPESKLQSNDMNIIVNYGYLNKFLLSTSSNVEKYCLLSKSNFCMYKSKETVLRKQKPFLMMSLKDIEKCDIVYMDFLNKKNLEDFYFFYILKKNLKFQIPQINNIVFNEEISEEYDMKNNSEVYNLLCLKKNILEQIFSRNDLIILYTENEDECNKWVCLINYFINYYKQKI